jgi:hypothetical protein
MTWVASSVENQVVLSSLLWLGRAYILLSCTLCQTEFLRCMEWVNKPAANSVAVTDAVLRQVFVRLMFMGCGKVCWLVDVCHCEFIRSLESPV